MHCSCFNYILTDQPEVHRIAADMREIADSYGARGESERVLIGEVYLPVDRLMQYYGDTRPEVHLPFNFQLIDTPGGVLPPALIANDEAGATVRWLANWVSATMTGRALPPSAVRSRPASQRCRR